MHSAIQCTVYHLIALPKRSLLGTCEPAGSRADVAQSMCTLTDSKQSPAEAKRLTGCWEECHFSRRFHMLPDKILHSSSTCNPDESAVQVLEPHAV